MTRTLLFQRPHLVTLMMLIAIILLLSSCTSHYQPLPSHNFDSRVKHVVIHFTAGNFEDSRKALVDKGGLSSHYLISSQTDTPYAGKPQIYKLVPETHRAWHAGVSSWHNRTNINDTSIGIELVYEPFCEQDAFIEFSRTLDAIEHCHFPDFDESQFTQLIRLLSDIATRHPELEPTAIIGHSDVAPNRKHDPGPAFPWQRLYDAGFGAWYDTSTQSSYLDLLSQAPTRKSWLIHALQAYGYGVDLRASCYAAQNLIVAFQMHFLPYHLTGEADILTAATVMALLDKYFPERVNELLTEYFTGSYFEKPHFAEQPLLDEAVSADLMQGC